VNRKIKREVLTAGMHGSTFGGNPLVCAAGLAVFKAIKKEKLLTNTVRMGELLEQEFEKLKAKYPVIESTRGMGLMRGLKLREPSASYANEARDEGLLINATQGDILRVMPPMTVSAKEIKLGMKILDNVFHKIQSKKSEGCACSNH
jgi:acetylornithine aminotransferase